MKKAAGKTNKGRGSTPLGVEQVRTATPGDHCPQLANISQLTINNVKVFDSFSLAIPRREAHKAHWMVLLGDNGTGKTTILQCIALAVLGPFLNALLARSSVEPVVRRGSDQLSAVKEGKVSVTAGGETFEVEIGPGDLRRGSRDHIVRRSRKRATQYWPTRPAVFGYGVCRDACPATEAENLSSAPVNSVGTLFDCSSPMANPIAWLRRLEGDANRAKLSLVQAMEQTRGSIPISEIPQTPEEQFFHSVVSVLKQALGLSDLTITPDGVFVVHPEQGYVPLGSLSSGFYAFARWLLDLIARYADLMRINGQTLAPDFNLRMRAIVLIDEIDLYLHPSWQRTVISELRALFPETTFVVSTHNPLCLLGAEPGEIFVLRRNEDTGLVEAEQRDLPPGIRPDEVLTGEWFDMLPSETMDSGTAALLEEHRRLLRLTKGPRRSERIAELEADPSLTVPAHMEADSVISTL